MKQLIKTKFILTNFSVLFIVVSLTLNNQVNVRASESIISSVTHQPSTIMQNTQVTVQITFLDDSEVNNIKIQYCSLEPDFTCHIPKISMIQHEENVWNGTFTVIETSGTIGYELIITLNNETEIKAPNSIDYLGYDNIAEPQYGVFYFTIVISPPTQNSPLNVSYFQFGLTFFGIICVRNVLIKRKRNA
ncbi:MAG: hypothetical protein ACFFDW_10870 [Candidatus Thorarchaeota archaeon]